MNSEKESPGPDRLGLLHITSFLRSIVIDLYYYSGGFVVGGALLLLLFFFFLNFGLC